MGKTLLFLIVGGIIAIALFGDGGLDVSPELSNEMRADFNYTNNSSNDTYNIERWVENENNYYEEKATNEAEAQEDNPCIQNGIDFCAATALPPMEGTSIPNFGMPSTLHGLEKWASQNGVELPNLWPAWSDTTKFEYLKARWEELQ